MSASSGSRYGVRNIDSLQGTGLRRNDTANVPERWQRHVKHRPIAANVEVSPCQDILHTRHTRNDKVGRHKNGQADEDIAVTFSACVVDILNSLVFRAAFDSPVDSKDLMSLEVLIKGNKGGLSLEVPDLRPRISVAF